MSKLINICQTHGSIYLSITSYDIDPNRHICDRKFCSGFEARKSQFAISDPMLASYYADFTHFLVQRSNTNNNNLRFL
jgi:hypothetical protein